MNIHPFYQDPSSTSRSLLYANFNQDFSCFALGLDNGFRIYACDPLKELSRREFYSYEPKDTSSHRLQITPGLPTIEDKSSSGQSNVDGFEDYADPFGFGPMEHTDSPEAEKDVAGPSMRKPPLERRSAGLRAEAGDLVVSKKDSPGHGIPGFQGQRELGLGAGVGICEMLDRCNFLALVGGGPNPCYPPNRVIIWDANIHRPAIELEFDTTVRSVRLLRDAIIIVLLRKTVVYSFTSRPKKVMTLETTENPRGLVAVASAPRSSLVDQQRSSTTTPASILAIPGRRKGQVQLIDIHPYVERVIHDEEHHRPLSSSRHCRLCTETGTVEPFPGTVVNGSVIVAHSTGISCMTLSFKGHLLATASEKGTLIRIHDTVTGRLLKEFRRGIDRADIYCINFDLDCQRLVVSSDKGTIHVFALASLATLSSGQSANNLAADISGENNSASSSPSSSCSASSLASANPEGGSYQQTQPSSSPLLSGSARSRLSFLSSFVPKYFSESSSQRSIATFRVDGTSIRDGASLGSAIQPSAHLTSYINVAEGPTTHAVGRGMRLFGKAQRLTSTFTRSGVGSPSHSSVSSPPKDSSFRSAKLPETTAPGKSIAALLTSQKNAVVVLVDDGSVCHWKFSEKRHLRQTSSSHRTTSSTASQAWQQPGPGGQPLGHSPRPSHSSNPTPRSSPNAAGSARDNPMRLVQRFRNSIHHPHAELDSEGFTSLQLNPT